MDGLMLLKKAANINIPQMKEKEIEELIEQYKQLIIPLPRRYVVCHPTYKDVVERSGFTAIADIFMPVNQLIFIEKIKKF